MKLRNRDFLKRRVTLSVFCYLQSGAVRLVTQRNRSLKLVNNIVELMHLEIFIDKHNKHNHMDYLEAPFCI